MTIKISEDLARQLHAELAIQLMPSFVQPTEPTPAPVPTIPAPPIPEFGPVNNDGWCTWTFLASLGTEWCTPPIGIIAKFAAAHSVLTEAKDRAVQMNSGANAVQKSNIAYTIKPTNPITNPWDYAHGVRWRHDDEIPGVVTMQDVIGTTGPNAIPVTVDVAKRILIGRMRGMAMSGNLRHWKRLGIDDYRRGA